jgi:hypothetical protein
MTTTMVAQAKERLYCRRHVTNAFFSLLKFFLSVYINKWMTFFTNVPAWFD